MFCYFKGLNNQRGMSLVELTVSMGILTIVALSSAYTLQGFTRSQIQAERRAELTEDSLNIGVALKSHSTGEVCTDIVSIDSGSFHPSNPDNVTLTMSGRTFSSGTMLNANFRFDSIYFANKILIGETPENLTYTTTIYATSSVLQDDNWLPLAPKSLGSLSVLVDKATGNMEDCNLSAMAVNSQAVCESVSGMVWVANSSECIRELETNSSGGIPDCNINGGFYLTADGECVPEKTDCTYVQRLPRQIANGTAQPTCDSIPPTDYVISHDPQYTYVDQSNPDFDSSGNANTSPPPKKCTCGNYTINSGDHCAKALPIDGGTLDFEGDCKVYVYQCANGNMPQVSTYKEEESDYCDSSYDRSLHPAQCNTNHTGCRW